MSEEKSRSFFKDLRISSERFRSENGLSQTELAAKLGVSGSALSNFEAGKSLLREPALEKLIELVGSKRAIAARDLRVLADIIDATDVSQNLKQERVAAVIQDLLDIADMKRVAENGAHYGE